MAMMPLPKPIQARTDKFYTVAEPYYAIMGPDEYVVATSWGLTSDPKVFTAFLQKGNGVAAAPAVAAADRTAALHHA